MLKLKFSTCYRNVEDIDLFPGGIAERPLEDGTIGPTFACILAYQFRALRNGDRYWYENPPPFGMFNKGMSHNTKKQIIDKPPL